MKNTYLLSLAPKLYWLDPYHLPTWKIFYVELRSLLCCGCEFSLYVFFKIFLSENEKEKKKSLIIYSSKLLFNSRKLFGQNSLHSVIVVNSL